MIFVVNHRTRAQEGGITVGDLDGISTRLSDFIDKVKKVCPKPISFADKNQVRLFRDHVFVTGDYPEEIVIYYKKDFADSAYLETGIAHELMHVYLKYSKSIPIMNMNFTTDNPNPDPQFLAQISATKNKVQFILNIIEDFWVDKEVQGMGFDLFEAIKKESIRLLEDMQDKKFIESFDPLKALGVYVQYFAFPLKSLWGIRTTDKMERNHRKLKGIFRNKLPSVSNDGDEIIKIIRSHNIFSATGYRECVNETIYYMSSQLGMRRVEKTSPPPQPPE